MICVLILQLICRTPPLLSLYSNGRNQPIKNWYDNLLYHVKDFKCYRKKKQNWRTGHIRGAMHPVQHLVDWVGVLFFCFHVQLNESQVLYLPMSVPIPSKASIWGEIIQCHKKMSHNLSKQRSPPRWLTGQESTSVSWLTGIRCPKSGKKKKPRNQFPSQFTWREDIQFCPKHP